MMNSLSIMMTRKWLYRSLTAVHVFLLSGAIFFATIAQVNLAKAADASDVIRELDSSGMLERAVEKILAKIGAKQQQAQDSEAKLEAERKEKMAENVRAPDLSKDHIFGAPDAEISIIEYSDFECSYCKHFHPTPQQVVRKLAGKVNLVFRHFPLDFHDPMASREAVGAICAGLQGGNQKFWAYADAVMNQTGSNGKGIPVKAKQDPIVTVASALKLDVKKFAACIQSEQAIKKLKDDIADGIQAGITGTPGIILRNNKTGKVSTLAGAVPDMVLEQKIRELSQ
jgi:protein-disulfide isomerase